MKKWIVFLLSSLFTNASPFLFGHWSIRGTSIKLLLDQRSLTSFVENGGILQMNHTIEPLVDREYLIELDDFLIVRRPKDWFNIKKYAYAIPFVRQLQTKKLWVKLRLLDEDTIVAKPYLGSDDALMPFLLTRLNETSMEK